MARADLIFGPVVAADAAGAILAHALRVGPLRWAKGRQLSAADAAAAVAAGVTHLTVARLDAGDEGEDTAAQRLAAAFAGRDIAAVAARHGRADLVAARAGLVVVDPAAVAAVNAVDERLTLATLPPLARAAAGAVVATVKVIPYAVPGDTVDRAVAVARPLGLAAFRPRRFILIQTRLPGTRDAVLARTCSVTGGRLSALGGTVAAIGECPHESDAVAAAIRAAPADATVLIVGASATADRDDIIPAAIRSAGGSVTRVGMPVDPGNLLCLGEQAGRPVIGLPGCARSPRRNGIDLVLERLAAGLPVDDWTIAAMGAGGLLKSGERAVVAAPVGAIVLAAGRSTRMATRTGGTHKLLADLGGRPLIAHTVAAVGEAGLPLLVVTGHRADELAAVLPPRTPRIVAAEYRQGLSRSLAAGLAAVPPWRAALIVLGDMPRVRPATLAAIAAAATAPDTVVVPTVGGIRGNPVAWGRAYWPRLATLSGDAGARALLAEVMVTEIETGDPGILADVDTPEDLLTLNR